MRVRSISLSESMIGVLMGATGDSFPVISWSAIGRLLSAAVIAVLFPAPALAATITPPHLSVPSATLVTMQGVPLWSHNPTAARRVASDIKMLTALVVRDHTKLEDVVVVPRQAAKVSSGGVGLVPGQRLTVRQLLNIMLIPSANDAAVTLAIHVGGTQPKFVAMMNTKAKAIGLKHTHATDPDGLNKKERSTASDLAVLAQRVMADSYLRKIVGTRSVSVPRPNGKRSVYYSTDLLLGHYKGMEGTKTGFTNPAGYCFVGSCKRGDVELVGVVLGASSNAGRFSQMRKLLDWGFAHCHVRALVSKDTTLGIEPVSGGVETSVSVDMTRTISAAVLDGSGPATVKLHLPSVIAAPVTAGQPVGTAWVYERGSFIATATVSAMTSVVATP
jgi:D-alanyl-D-alanine carboxypeptidase (penicillin-binding protein 5/6)